MLRIVADIFSGRPNPTWIVTNDSLVQKVTKALAADHKPAGESNAPFGGLGLRGLEVEFLNVEDDADGATSKRMLLASGSASLKHDAAVAELLIKEMTKAAKISLPSHALTPLNKGMQKLLLSELARFLEQPPIAGALKRPRTSAVRQTTPDSRCRQCQYEISRFNPNFWNADPNVRARNNCYNYARNWRTNTFAQPGRASGHPTSVMQCAKVAAAARSDGLVDRCRCLPASEYPRRLMALVIWPGYDYHWYRHQMGNFWGHKPGSTPAKNTDNSGVVITNPETCNRGGYSNFCGYFYAGKSVRIV